MFRGRYVGWTESRFRGLMKYINKEYFYGKTVLELGAGHGHNGNEMFKLGAIVTSSDASSDHIHNLNKLYPHIKTQIIDAVNDKIVEKFDIILHWGLLYHLSEIESHLKNVCENCNLLLLETEVSDSYDNLFYITTDENGYDQAFNKKGIRPSPTYVEKILQNNGFNFFMVKDSILNYDIHNYDWEITDSKMWRHGLRRFWICWKGIESPINTINTLV
jgi:hypothetical protein